MLRDDAGYFIEMSVTEAQRWPGDSKPYDHSLLIQNLSDLLPSCPSFVTFFPQHSQTLENHDVLYAVHLLIFLFLSLVNRTFQEEVVLCLIHIPLLSAQHNQAHSTRTHRSWSIKEVWSSYTAGWLTNQNLLIFVFLFWKRHNHRLFQWHSRKIKTLVKTLGLSNSIILKWTFYIVAQLIISN